MDIHLHFSCGIDLGKLGIGIDLWSPHNLEKMNSGWRPAIADDPIDAGVDGKKIFCVQIQKMVEAEMMFGFTPTHRIDEWATLCLGTAGLPGVGLFLYNGTLCYPFDQQKVIIDRNVSQKAKEVITILTVSNNGKKKEIQFIVNGVESKSTDVSQYLKENRLFPTLCLSFRPDRVLTIPIDQVKIRTPAVEKLIAECEEYKKNKNNGAGAVAATSTSASTSSLLLLVSVCFLLCALFWFLPQLKF
jgi:hypothetical protein